MENTEQKLVELTTIKPSPRMDELVNTSNDNFNKIYTFINTDLLNILNEINDRTTRIENDVNELKEMKADISDIKSKLDQLLNK